YSCPTHAGPPDGCSVSLHGALPICRDGKKVLRRWRRPDNPVRDGVGRRGGAAVHTDLAVQVLDMALDGARAQHEHLYRKIGVHRSEEHTSELQSQSNLVCRLLLEKK